MHSLLVCLALVFAILAPNPHQCTDKQLAQIRQVRSQGRPLSGSSARKHYRRAMMELLGTTNNPALIDTLETAIRVSEEALNDDDAAQALRDGLEEAERMLRQQRGSR